MTDLSIYLKHTFDCKSDEGLDNLVNEITLFNKDTDLAAFDVAILGVQEERGTTTHLGCANGPDKIRAQFYKLYNHFKDLKILDLGNVLQGNSLNDTYFAVSEVVKELVKKDVVLLLLGGSQDLTFANFLAYEQLEQAVNLLTIDPSIDIGLIGEAITDKNYIHHILVHEPNYLFNYSNVGFQSYFVSKEIWKLMDSMHFDALRLGQVRQNISEVEPLLRAVDIVSIDVAAVRNSDLPGCQTPSPNGFYGEEICQLSKYAGASEKLSSFGLFNYNPSFDPAGNGAMLCAQIIWYFMDGVANRIGDYPVATKDSLTKYIVQTNEQGDLNFYKSKTSNRWWVEVPYPSDYNKKFIRHTMVPCSYSDYVQASNGDTPEKVWQMIQKII